MSADNGEFQKKIPPAPPFRGKNAKTPADCSAGVDWLIRYSFNYSCGPAATRALPASLPVYFTKFLVKRAARSFAFTSHSAASA